MAGKLFTHLHANYEGEKAAKGGKEEGREVFGLSIPAELAANQWRMLMEEGHSEDGRGGGRSWGGGGATPVPTFQNECHVQMSCQSMDTLQ